MNWQKVWSIRTVDGKDREDNIFRQGVFSIAVLTREMLYLRVSTSFWDNMHVLMLSSDRNLTRLIKRLNLTDWGSVWNDTNIYLSGFSEIEKALHWYLILQRSVGIPKQKKHLNCYRPIHHLKCYCELQCRTKKTRKNDFFTFLHNHGSVVKDKMLIE